jgi:hypothetical protein
MIRVGGVNPNCMCSVVVTALPFPHEAASFVLCLRPTLSLAGRFSWSFVSVATNYFLANLFLVCLHHFYLLCALWHCVQKQNRENIV